MFAELGMERCGQRALVGGGDVGFDIFEFAHAGDDGGDVMVVEDEAQRHFRHGRTGRYQRLERVGVFDAGAKIFRDEISAAPIVGGPGGFESQHAAERTFVKGNASDDADIVRTTSRKKFVLGILIEDVVDDLNGVNQAGLDGADAVPGFPAIHADADGLDPAAGA